MTSPTSPDGGTEVSPQPTPRAGRDELFFEIWLKALIRPREATYQAIVSAPGATVSRGALWLFLATLVSTGLAALLQLGQLSSVMSELAETSDLGPIAGAGALLLICILPFTSAFQVAWTMFYTWVLDFVAGALGGSGRYQELFFGLTSIWAPVSLASGILSSIPFVGGCLTLPVSLYALYLNALVIKAVHRIGWGRAIITLLVPVIIMILIFVIVIFALIVPLFGEYLQNGVPSF